jgi:hypothetical protein
MREPLTKQEFDDFKRSVEKRFAEDAHRRWQRELDFYFALFTLGVSTIAGEIIYLILKSK